MRKIKIIFIFVFAVLLIIAFYSEGAIKPTITLIPKIVSLESEKTKIFTVKTTGKISKNVKWYVKVDESLGNGDGTITSFTLGNQNIQENTEVISVGGVKKTKATDYTIDYVMGTVNFIVPPDISSEITASYYAENGGTKVGTIDATTGTYTAPAKEFLTSNPMEVDIKAVSVDKPQISGKAVVKVFTFPSIISLSISPATASVGINETIDFTLNVVKKGKKNLSVKWYANDILGGNKTVGTIKGTGLISGTYTAPSKILAKPVTIKVVSSLNENIFSKAKVTIADQLIANGISLSYDFGLVITGQDITIPIRETFTITTKTGNPAGWQLGSIPQWLQITPRSGTTPDQVVMEVIDTGRLNIGINSGTIIFQPTKNGVNPLTINVSINAISKF